MAKIWLYDSTLRDGAQAQGVNFSLEDKLLIAKKLDQLGIDYIEGGYAVSNPKDMEFFYRVQELGLKHSKIAGFGSTRRADGTVEKDPSLNAIIESGAPVGTIVAKSWDFHVTEVIRCSLEENLVICSESVKYLFDKGLEEVIFDAEHFFDGYKHNPEYAMKVLESAVKAKASCLALCDTNGGCLPGEIAEITGKVVKAFPDMRVGIHCHNDSDCAVANSLFAIEAGALHVQGTINGIGERTGNANLCTIIPNLTFKMDRQTLDEEHLKMLTETSIYVSEIANLTPPINMAYVGESAFAHKAGLHVNALRKNKKTYEHVDPEVVGNERKFLISELSGRDNILAKLEKRNFEADKVVAKQILERVQDLENEGYQFEAADASFDILVMKVLNKYRPAFDLIKYHVNIEKDHSGNVITEATVKLSVDGQVEHVVSEGDGPVDALYNALRKSLDRFYPQIKDMHLFDYKVRIVNAGAATAAKIRVVIETRDKDDIWGTVGVNENIVDASWQALVDSIDYKLIKDRSF